MSLERPSPPFTVTRFRLPGRLPIESEVYPSFEEAMAEAKGRIVYGLTIEVTITDSEGAEHYSGVSDNRIP